MKKVLLIALVFTTTLVVGQNQNVGIGTLTPDNSAVLDVVAKDKGLLIPRLDSTDRAAIGSPANGLITYDETVGCYFYYKRTEWKSICDMDSILQLVDSMVNAGVNTAWKLLGNSGTDPDTNFLGTIDSVDLVIRTNNHERIRVAANGGNVGVGGVADNSAIMDLQASDRGFLLPRLDSAQINAIASPVNGLMVYNNEENCVWYFKSSYWKSMCDLDTINATLITVDSIDARSATVDSLWVNGVRIDSVIQGQIDSTAWLLFGNSNTDPDTNFLGTIDSVGLTFRTNNIPRVRVTPDSGMVGIGTMIPEYNLDVTGDIGLTKNIHQGDSSVFVHYYRDESRHGAGMMVNARMPVGGANPIIGSEFATVNQNTGFNITRAGMLDFDGDLGLWRMGISDTIGLIGSNVLMLPLMNMRYGSSGFISFSPTGSNFTDLSISNSGKVGVNSPGVHNSAVMDIYSENRGVLLPSMVNDSMNAIPSPVNGLTIYNTDSTCLYFYKNGYWKSLCHLDTTSLRSLAWMLDGNANTDTSVNFLGTTDDVDLVFKTDDSARIIIGKDGGVLFSGPTVGDINSTIPPLTSGNNVELMWYPPRGAFRSGNSLGAWVLDSLGLYSSSFGIGNSASGFAGFSSGETNANSSYLGFVHGRNNILTGDQNVVFGTLNNTSNFGHHAIGSGITLSGTSGIGVGHFLNDGGWNSAFMMGSAGFGVNTVTATTHSEFNARFQGGYRLFTDNANTQGVTMGPGAGSWTTISDSTKKHDFYPISGEEILNAISQVQIQSWRYKAEDFVYDPDGTKIPQYNINGTPIRHIGIMAQDFWNSFHLGRSDTGIVVMDAIGINMLAIQALEKRTRAMEGSERYKSTEEYEAELEALRQENYDLKMKVEEISVWMEKMKKYYSVKE